MAIWDLDKTAANNTTVEGISRAEGMNPSAVNNGMRADAAMLAQWAADIGAALTTGGTANAQTLTTNGTLAALADGVLLGFVAGATNTAAATLNVDSLGAKSLRKWGDVDLDPNDIAIGGHYLVTYDASANSAAGAWILHEVGRATPTLHVRDEKTSGTEGGAAAAATWNTRTQNTTVYNGITGASLASNQITLPVGTYEVAAFAGAFSVDRHKVRFRNVTDGTTAIAGLNAFAQDTSPEASIAVLNGKFTIAASKAFELQHYTELAKTGNGLGVAVSSGEVEVYSEAVVRKIA